MAIFDQEAVRLFEDRMAKHLKEVFPKECEWMGDESAGRGDSARPGARGTLWFPTARTAS